MSRIAEVVQAFSADCRISHRLMHLPCGRCNDAIEYEDGEDWSVVSKLVDKHWKACPRKLHGLSTRMACTPTSPPDAAIALPLPAASNPHSVPVAESVGSSNNTRSSPVCERKRRTLEQRKSELEQDEYAQNVTTKSVVCSACHKEISLDKRSEYYPGLWVKHRGKCPRIERLERAKAEVSQGRDNTRQVPYDGVNPAFAFGHRDVLQHGSVKTYESRGATTTPQSVPYDSKISEDEDDDVDEPFPTVNGDFYRAERQRNGSVEWAYRYATKEEIATNRFRGQDEPYAYLSGRRYNTYHSLQTGGQPRCVFENRL